MRIDSYFSLNEIALMSLCGALIFVLKTALKLPVHLPGHSGIFWVIPLIVGMALVRKPGTGLYIGLISGILASFFGIGALHVFDLLKYISLGASADIIALFFGYRLDNPAVAVLTGAFANVVKMLVNYGVQLALGVQPFFIVLGIGISSVSHIIFGGLGGLLSAYIIQRLMRAGVIEDGTGKRSPGEN